MRSSKWRAGKDHPRPLKDETPARTQALLKLSSVGAQPSAQLRTRVLTSFQHRMDRKHSLWMWLAPGIAASVMIVAALIVFGYWNLRGPKPPVSLPTVANKIVDLHPANPVPQVPAEPRRLRRAVRKAKQHHPADSFVAKEPVVSSDLPLAQFDSLMYCDRFSCGDPMQVIRLEMPASSVGRAYRPLARNGFVNAEVIVGTDGLTRAVRFTK